MPVRPRLGILLLSTALALGGLTVAARPTSAAPSPRIFYLSPTGSDIASGQEPDRAWRSLRRLAKADLLPGDQVLLERGGVWSGTLRIGDSGTAAAPIIVGAYGQGARPLVRDGGCVRIGGSEVIVEHLRATRCTDAGFSIGGDHVTVRRSRATHNITGVYVADGADYAQVLGNELVDNNRMAPDTPYSGDDHGATGVDLIGDHARIAWNHISGSHAPSHDFGVDGSAVEVYGSNYSRVDHNTSVDNLTFTELGHSTTSHITFAYNVVTGSLKDANFLITHGPHDYWGPVRRVTAEHNTVRLTGKGTQAFWCGGRCGPSILSLSDNVFVARARIGYAPPDSSGYGIGGGNNIYWGAVVEHTKRPGDRKVNPRFISATDLRLRASSPAVDLSLTGQQARSEAAADDGAWTQDVDGTPLPLDGNDDGVAIADAGAFEYQP